MDRKIKKEKKEGDTCRDCWTKRFRKELYAYWQSLHGSTQGRSSIPPVDEFLAQEHKIREELVHNLQIEARDVYDEMKEIEVFAGEMFMHLYDPEAESEKEKKTKKD